jgi:hypothetical protein
MKWSAPRSKAILLVATALAIVLITFFAAWRVVERLGATPP